MIRVELDEPTLTRTRIAISPLWETVCSLMLLDRSPRRIGFPFQEWEVRARQALASDAMRFVREAYLGRSREFPDFLAPAPLTAMPTIEEELDALRATSDDEIVTELQAYVDFPLHRRQRGPGRVDAVLVRRIDGGSHRAPVRDARPRAAVPAQPYHHVDRSRPALHG